MLKNHCSVASVKSQNVLGKMEIVTLRNVRVKLGNAVEVEVLLRRTKFCRDKREHSYLARVPWRIFLRQLDFVPVFLLWRSKTVRNTYTPGCIVFPKSDPLPKS